MSKLVTVIIPIYNVEKYINKCISSVINQTYKNLDIILVDDGSTDDSCDICDFYKEKDTRIHVIHKKNGGLSDARNVAIGIAKGEYLTFIDGDDFVSENYVEVLVELVEQSKSEISIVGLHYVDEDGNNLQGFSKHKNVEILNKEVALKEIMYQKKVSNSACAKLYKISLFENIRYPKGELYEDIKVTYQLILKSNSIAVSSESLYHYLYRVGSISKNIFSINHMKRLTNAEEMVENIGNLYPSVVTSGKVRLFGAAFSVIQMMGNNKKDFKVEYLYALKVLKKNRLSTLLNTKASKKNRLQAILTYVPIIGIKLSCGFR